MGDLNLYLKHGSLEPSGSASQTAFRSVQPFLRAHNLTNRHT